MSKNILPEIAKMLDVEMYEKFKIEGMSSDLVFRIGVDGLEMERFDYAEDDRIWVTLASCNFVDLLTGKANQQNCHGSRKKARPIGHSSFMIPILGWVLNLTSGLTTYLTLHFLKQDGYIVATRKPKRHSLP